jgi:hypothetical protein
MYEEIIKICQNRKNYSYPDTHIWYTELFNAINKRYAGCLSTAHYTEQINTLADIICELAAAQHGVQPTAPVARRKSRKSTSRKSSTVRGG